MKIRTCKILLNKCLVFLVPPPYTTGRMISDDEKADIICTFKSGDSLNAIAKRLHRGRPLIRRVLREAGLDTSTNYIKAKRRRRKRALEIICRWQGGETQAALAAEYGTTQPAISFTIRDYMDTYREAFDAL